MKHTAASLLLLVTTVHCGGEENPCSHPASLTVAGENCVIFDSSTEQLGAERPQVEQILEEAMAHITSLMPTRAVAVRVHVRPERTIPEVGIGGRAVTPHELLLFLDPDSPAFAASLELELARMLAHEMHHVRRSQTHTYGTTLLEAAISEGLADHFSLEAFGGEAPLWSTALGAAELDELTERAAETWHAEPYDHSAWFFGTDRSIPRWTGYSIGYALVDRFLASYPSARPSTLHAERAERFVP